MELKFILASIINGMVAVTAAIGAIMFAMTDAVIIAIVGAIVTVITSIAGAYFAYKAKTVAVETQAVAKETSKAVDGKMEEFKAMAQQLFRAEGVVEGRVIAETKAAIIAEAKAAGKAEGKAENAAVAQVMPVATTASPVPVKVVEGPGVDEPLKVTNKREGKE